MRGCSRLRRGSAGQILPANGQESSQFPNWDEMGIPPGFFLESAQVDSLQRVAEYSVFGSAQAVHIAGVAAVRRSNQGDLSRSLYYLSDIVPQI
jgi:hypothetical protein